MATGASVNLAGGDIRKQAQGWGGEKGGDMSIDAGGQHVLERTSVIISDNASFSLTFSSGPDLVLGTSSRTNIAPKPYLFLRLSLTINVSAKPDLLGSIKPQRQWTSQTRKTRQNPCCCPAV